MQELVTIFNEYGVPATVIGKTVGCRITTYDVQLNPGARKLVVKRILDEIATRLGAKSAQLIQLPEKKCFGVVVCSEEFRPVKIGDIFRSDEYRDSEKKLKFIIGETPEGKKMYSSLTDARHMLIGGQSGSGKSVFINVMLLSLMQQSPKDMQMILIDPKRVELSAYNDIPHLITPVVTEPEDCCKVLDWVVSEMDRRYKLFQRVSEHNNTVIKEIDEFNTRLRVEDNQHKVPRLVVVIDELAQLLMTTEKDVEKAIVKIAQLGRACGIHLIVATQRPSADVITPLIKANLPTKVAFAVSTKGNSKIILNQEGADLLLGKGDMLYMEEDDLKPVRVQGAYVSDREISNALKDLKDRNSKPKYNQAILDKLDKGGNAKDYGLNMLGKTMVAHHPMQAMAQIIHEKHVVKHQRYVYTECLDCGFTWSNDYIDECDGCGSAEIQKF